MRYPKIKYIKRVISLLLIMVMTISLMPCNMFIGYKGEGNRELASEILSEGMVLLKNNGALPLTKEDRVAVFGNSQIDYYVGGGGSSVMFTDYEVSVTETLKKAAEEGKFGLYTELMDIYGAYVETRQEVSDKYGEDAFVDGATGEIVYGEMPLSDELMQKAKNNANVALVFISRYSTEGYDMDRKDYYLSNSEKKMLESVTKYFDEVIVILNVPCIMDSGWFAGDSPDYDIDAVLMGWYFGEETEPLADVLCGDTSPSGKLTVTMASDYTDYFSSSNFDQKRDVYYEEDIFVGYRQFETFDPNYTKVNFEFGFGLSYTEFDIRCVEAGISPETGYIQVKVKVTNTGSKAGKEVVQVYFSAPQGVLGKPGKELAAFAKTEELKPGKSQTLTLSFPVSDMSSYDDTGKVAKSAYILEAGDYRIYVGNSIKDAGKRNVYTHKIEAPVIAEQLTERAYSTRLTQRLLANGTFEQLEKRRVDQDVEFIEDYPNTATAPESLITLVDVYKDPSLMDSFLAQLTIEEMAMIAGGQDVTIGAAAGGIFGNILNKYMIPSIECTDGSVGVRVYSTATYFPSALCLASTWNTDLAYRFGQAVGQEAAASGIDIWLGPSLNIIRNPLCGRNFEYYSEDPLISGRIAAAVTKGVQEAHVGVTLKHYAANNKETDRGPSDSQVSERALREIYLKGFEICVKEADPWGIMTTCGTVNGSGLAGNYDFITAIPRKEWGFTGLFMSDWANMDGEIEELLAGHNLSMPRASHANLVRAYEKGKITRGQLESNTYVLLSNLMKMHSFRKIAVDSTVISKKGITNISPLDYYWKSNCEYSEEKVDDKGKPLYIGELSEGTELFYRFTIEKAGEYTFSTEFFSLFNMGSHTCTLNGEPLYDFACPQDIVSSAEEHYTVDNIKTFLEEGTYELKLTVTQTGLNLCNFSLQRDSSGDVEPFDPTGLIIGISIAAAVLVAAAIVVIVIVVKKKKAVK